MFWGHHKAYWGIPIASCCRNGYVCATLAIVRLGDGLDKWHLVYGDRRGGSNFVWQTRSGSEGACLYRALSQSDASSANGKSEQRSVLWIEMVWEFLQRGNTSDNACSDRGILHLELERLDVVVYGTERWGG